MSVQCRVLSDSDIRHIYLAALEILERTGTRVENREAIELLAGAGACVEGDRVHLPGGLVENAVSRAPRRARLVGRDGRVLTLGGDNCYYGTGSDCPNYLDPHTGERRHFTAQDVADAARVVDALPNIDFHMSFGLMQDVPPGTYDRHQFLAMATNQTKPMVVTATDLGGFRDIYRMACAIVGGESELRRSPLIALYAEPISPLIHGSDAIEKLLFAAAHFVPAVYTSGIMAGANAPATLAGALAQGLAEGLAGLAIAQLKQPGTPVISGGSITIMDMAATVYAYGAPELSLMEAAYADILRWLGLPFFTIAGAGDAKVFDQQAACEATYSLLMAGLYGGHLTHDVGYLESGLTGSLDMLVASDEIIGMVKRLVRGISVNEESLATSVVDAVGPGGHFMDQDHTLKHFRQEFWFPKLMDRRRWDVWQGAGELTLGDRTRARVREILRSHRPEPLPAAVLEELHQIVASADADLAR